MKSEAETPALTCTCWLRPHVTHSRYCSAVRGETDGILVIGTMSTEASQGNPTGPLSRRPDWKVLMPGLTQMAWCQRERGLVYLLTFLSSLGTSLFCWGSRFGWCFLAFCCLTHLAASLDVVRQRAFPVFPRKAALAAALLGFGLTLYLPIGFLLHSYAFATSADAFHAAWATWSTAWLTRRGNQRPATDLDAALAGIDAPSGAGCGRCRARSRVDGSSLAG